MITFSDQLTSDRIRLIAIDAERDPIHNGLDHVRTLKYVEAAYESIQHNRVVTL